MLDKDYRFASIINKKALKSTILFSDIYFLVVFGILVKLIGLQALFFILLIPIWIAISIGLVLFYLQHNFEGVYFDDSYGWNFAKSALLGSSFCKLPAILNWFTCNIAYHHIHHLNTRVPYYKLPRCFADLSELQTPKIITLKSIPSLFHLKLYDYKQGKFVTFRQARKHMSQPEQR